MKARLIYGFLLGPLFLFFLLQSLPWVLLSLLVVHVLAQLEFISLIEGLSRRAVISHVIFSSLVMLALGWGLASRPALNFGLVLLAVCVIGYSLAAVLDYERGRSHQRTIMLLRSLLFVTLPLSFIPAIAMANAVVPPLLLLIGASWGADTAAIFCGKLFGKHKLAPRLSPKKTIEGVIGGMLGAGLIFCLAGILYHYEILLNAARIMSHSPNLYANSAPIMLHIPQIAMRMFVVGALISVVGVIGDLTFSLFKREAGIKDYSLVIPGHGGILDRFDSMLFVAPILYLMAVGWQAWAQASLRP